MALGAWRREDFQEFGEGRSNPRACRACKGNNFEDKLFLPFFFLFSSFFFYFFKKIDNTTHNTQRREGVALSSLVFFVFEITIAKGQ